MKKVKNISISLILFFLSFLTVYFVYGGIVSNIVISGETTVMPFTSYLSLTENQNYFLQMFLSSDHSWFFVSFVTHLFSRVLPVLTNIHPQDFYLKYGWYLYLLIFCIFCHMLALNISKYFKQSIFRQLAFWVVFPVVVINLVLSYFIWGLCNDTWFLCYFLNSIFPLLLFQILEKNYVVNDEIIPPPPGKRKNNFLFFGVLGLILLTSIGHEFYRFVLCGTLAITFIFNNFFLKEKISLKKFLIFYPFVLFANCFLFLLPSFGSWYKVCVNTTPAPLSEFFATVKAFYDCVIVVNSVTIGLIISFSIAVFFLTENKSMTKRLLIFVWSTCFSILAFNYVVIFISNLDLELSQHDGITFLTNTAFSFVLFSLIGFLLAHCSLKFKKAVKISCSIFFVCCCIFAYNYSYKLIKLYNFISENKRENQYIVEKLYDLYGKDHNIIYATFGSNTIMPASISFFKYWYGTNGKRYQVEYVCTDEKDEVEPLNTCTKQMLDVLYSKTGYRMSQEELKETNFSSLSSYKEQKKNGKIFVDFFNNKKNPKLD